jgi:hypothetical protein
LPVEQAVQLPWEAAAKKPAAQALHALRSAAKSPGRQSVQDAASPADDDLPAEQLEQEVEPAELYSPTAHGSHAAWPDDGARRPAAQAVHEDSPADAEDQPTLQLVHAAAPDPE